MQVIFLYNNDDLDSNELHKRLIKQGLEGKISCIEIDDSSTLQWLTNNSKNINIHEIPCFLIQRKSNLGKLETEVVSFTEVDYVLNLINVNEFF